MADINPRQQAFVDEYIIDFNGTQAAIRAGYSENTAAEIASENLRKPRIQAAIAAAMEKRTKRTNINADYVLRRIGEIDEMDCADILNDDGTMKPILQWPKIWRQMICGLDITELTSSEGATVAVKKIKWPDKVKNLELMGRHVDVSAFRDSVKLSGDKDNPVAVSATLNFEAVRDRINKSTS